MALARPDPLAGADSPLGSAAAGPAAPTPLSLPTRATPGRLVPSGRDGAVWYLPSGSPPPLGQPGSAEEKILYNLNPFDGGAMRDLSQPKSTGDAPVPAPGAEACAEDDESKESKGEPGA